VKRYLWIALVTGALGAIVVYREWPAADSQSSARGGGIGREIPVRVLPVKQGPIAHVLKTSGDVLPLMQVDVVSRVPGYVEQIGLDIGDPVAAGQTVAAIDPREQRHKVEEDEATLKVAAAALKERESQLAEAEKQAERARLLRAKDFISSQELESAETRVLTARAQKELAEAQLEQRRAALAQSRYQFGLTRVVAPFAGVITRRLVDPGAHVSTTTPIATIAAPDPLKVVVNIPEQDVSLVRTGMTAKLELDAMPGRIFEGRIARLNSALDSASRTLAAEVHVPNRQRLLKPGMFARVTLVLAEEKKAFLIPAEAIIEEEGRSYVYSVADGKAARKAVKRGWEQDGVVAIRDGVAEGEEIVVAGQHRLKPGIKVRLIQGDEARSVP
jgi:membrane fusion protein (multidrug efflux system)